MEDIYVKRFGLFASMNYNERGLPIGGKEIVGGTIPPDLKEVIFYFLFAGKPGSYWLTVNVKSEPFEDAEAKVTIPSQYLTIPTGGDSHFELPVIVESFPRGNYEFEIRLASAILAQLEFIID